MSDTHAHQGGADHGGADHGGMDNGHTVGTHGMLLFGRETFYLSHLPMFDSPHNFQVLLEVRFDDAVRDVLVSEAEAGGDNMYTFVPVPFPIAELAPSAGGAPPARTSIEGPVVRGHFEHGGEPIAEEAVASVERVVAFAELDVDAEPAPDRELTYLCFGRGDELYLVHEITARPSFDHVLSARLVPDSGTDQAGRRLADEVAGRGFDVAVPVRFRGRTDTPQSRLTAPETVEGFFFRSIGPGGVHGFLVQVETQRELYLQVDELA